MSAHILIVPEHEVSRRDEEVRWCFRCRKHLLHELVISDVDDPWRWHGFYGRNARIECVGCGEDHADFPGTYRDGPRYTFA